MNILDDQRKGSLAEIGFRGSPTVQAGGSAQKAL
jgi:hypothetical protein